VAATCGRVSDQTVSVFLGAQLTARRTIAAMEQVAINIECLKIALNEVLVALGEDVEAGWWCKTTVGSG
jgi:hypothetical protein